MTSERKNIEQTLWQMIGELPTKLSRAEALYVVASSLSTALLQNGEIEPSVRVEWADDELKVTLPTRPHYLFDVDIIGRFIEDVVWRVDLQDLSELSAEDFEARMRRLRDGGS